MNNLLEEAKEKCAGLLGEKFRGLSRGLLPVGTTRKRDAGEGDTKVEKEDVTKNNQGLLFLHHYTELFKTLLFKTLILVFPSDV